MDELGLSGFSLLVSYVVVAVISIAGWRAFVKKDPDLAKLITDAVKTAPAQLDALVLKAKREAEAEARKTAKGFILNE